MEVVPIATKRVPPQKSFTRIYRTRSRRSVSDVMEGLRRDRSMELQCHSSGQGCRFLLRSPRSTCLLREHGEGRFQLRAGFADSLLWVPEYLAFHQDAGSEPALGERSLDGLSIESTLERMGADVRLANRSWIGIAPDNEDPGANLEVRIPRPVDQASGRSCRVGCGGLQALSDQLHSALLVLLGHHVVRLPGFVVVHVDERDLEPGKETRRVRRTTKHHCGGVPRSDPETDSRGFSPGTASGSPAGVPIAHLCGHEGSSFACLAQFHQVETVAIRIGKVRTTKKALIDK